MRNDPDGAQTWLQGVDQIFHAMVTTDDQNVILATHMLMEEAKFWWVNANRRLEAGGAAVSWERLKEEFLKKYFPTDLRNKKEVMFLQLKKVCRLWSMLLSLRSCLGFVLTSMLKVLKSLSVSSLRAVYAQRSISMCASMRFVTLTLW